MKFQECFKKVSRVFQECLEVVSRKFQRCCVAQYVRAAGPATRVAGSNPLELVSALLSKNNNNNSNNNNNRFIFSSDEMQRIRKLTKHNALPMFLSSWHL